MPASQQAFYCFLKPVLRLRPSDAETGNGPTWENPADVRTVDDHGTNPYALVVSFVRLSWALALSGFNDSFCGSTDNAGDADMFCWTGRM